MLYAKNDDSAIFLSNTNILVFSVIITQLLINCN